MGFLFTSCADLVDSSGEVASPALCFTDAGGSKGHMLVGQIFMLRTSLPFSHGLSAMYCSGLHIPLVALACEDKAQGKEVGIQFESGHRAACLFFLLFAIPVAKASSRSSLLSHDVKVVYIPVHRKRRL